MASFYAELHVAGHVYPLRTCQYEFTQATDERGRVVAKVRHGLVRLVLDVPRDNFLMSWAVAVHKPLPGYVVFYTAKGGAAFETVSWDEGHCVHYSEEFESSRVGVGAYSCHVHVAASKLVLSAGGPPVAFVAPAPREYAYVPPPAVATQPRTGGRGPTGLGDTIGTFSKRPYDPDNCGGPIANLNWENVVIVPIRSCHHHSAHQQV